MRIVLYPADQGACGNLRMIWPGMMAGRAGYDVEVFDPGPMTGVPVKAGRHPVSGELGAELIGDPDFDVIVFQRPLSFRTPLAIPLLQSVGVRCVVEIDDDLAALHTKHEAYYRIHPQYNPEGNWRYLQAACDLADAVVVTTPQLAQRYGRKSEAIVVENCVPRRYLDAEHEPNERLRVGWTGRAGTHPGDLDILRGSLQRAVAALDAEFHVLGATEGAREAAGLTDEPHLVQGVPMEQYPHEVARFDIGIAPLGDTPFNAAKSWLKALDYAACGVPFVCSDTPEYRRFVSQGAGLIAKRPRDWASKIRRLGEDAGLRSEMAEAGREVARNWILEDHVDRFVEAWAGRQPAPSQSSNTDTKEGA